MQSKSHQTNAVSFGKYGIVLEKDQLSYYADGDLTKVIDVKSDFTNSNLFDLAERIAKKNNYGSVNFVHKDRVAKSKIS
jgi:hypothetical protein